MGVDFIREESGKPWRKRWDRGLDGLKTPGLFDLHFCENQRTFTADLERGCGLSPGDEVVVQRAGERAIICRGQQCIGSIPTLPADAYSEIANLGGVAVGKIERIGLFDTNAELSIR